MSLSDLAAIGSLVSGLAVLVSLVYLSLQARQTERNQRAAMHQGFSSREFDLTFRVSEPHFADVYRRAFTSEEDFTQTEVLQLMNLVRATLLSVEDSYVLRKESLMDEASFETSLGPMKALFSLPVFRALWPMLRATFSAEFFSFIDAEIRKIPIRQQVDLSAQLKSNLTRVRIAAA